MWPTLIEINTSMGPMGIHTYGVTLLVAFCAAFALVHIRAPKVGFHPDRLMPIYIAAAIGGLIGARILYMVILDPWQIWTHPTSLLSPGGLTFYGGLLGGSVATLITARMLNIGGWKLLDVLAPALLLGLGIGRLGCFFAGCCHGAAISLSPSAQPLIPEGWLHGQLWLQSAFPFLALEFQEGVGRIQNLPLYPTQLWSAAAGIGLAVCLVLWSSRKKFDGQIVGFMLILEPIFRIIIEAFRADQRGVAIHMPILESISAYFPGFSSADTQLGEGMLVGLTTSQTIGLFMVLLGCSIIWTRRFSGIAPEIPIHPDLGPHQNTTKAT